MSDAIRTPRARPFRQLRSWPDSAASAGPLLFLWVPAALQLRVVEPLLHASVLYPDFSRASLLVVPMAGLVIINVWIFAATRSLGSAPRELPDHLGSGRGLILGAVGLVDTLDGLGTGLD